MQPYGYQPYVNGYPSMVNNPYLQQTYSPYSQQSQPTLNEVIAGCIVDSEDVVKSKNCNLDGSATYYPLSDQSAIYVKKLNPQTGAGTMFKYKLDIPVEKTSISIEQQVADLLNGFKSEISQEIGELKDLVLENVTAPVIQKDTNTFMNKPRGGERS